MISGIRDLVAFSVRESRWRILPHILSKAYLKTIKISIVVIKKKKYSLAAHHIDKNFKHGVKEVSLFFQFILMVNKNKNL